MKKVIARLEELKDYYERISEQATEALEELQVEGNIRIQNCRGADEFFLCTIKGDTKGKYLKKHERGIIKQIIQRDYNRKVLKCANDWMVWIDSTLKKIPAETLQRIYEKSHRRKSWIVPYELPDDEYRKQWEQVEYTGKEFKEATPEIYTEKGIRVRSKSEKMIADKLDLLEIPYRYEYPINIDERRIVYPDCCPLN